MEINKRQADEIVENLRSVIKEDINFISVDGIIIASSDESRVGSIHGGALEVVKTSKMVIVYSDEQYPGARKGINLPVYVDGNLIAIIGITGEADEIMQFSNVILKMSEILIRENFLSVQKEFKRENNRIIMEYIINNRFNPQILKELGYNVASFCFFVIFKINNFEKYNAELINRIYNSIEKRVSFHDIVARNEDNFLVLTQISDYNELKGLLEQTKSYVDAKYKINVSVGISGKIVETEELFYPYKEAKMVVDFKNNKNLGKIKQFDGLNLEYLFESLTEDVKQKFYDGVLGVFNEKELSEAKEIIEAYIMFNGSIQKISEHLFIHKNTVQYRLNKIHNLSGYNPRIIKDLILLYVGLSFY